DRRRGDATPIAHGLACRAGAAARAGELTGRALQRIRQRRALTILEITAFEMHFAGAGMDDIVLLVEPHQYAGLGLIFRIVFRTDRNRQANRALRNAWRMFTETGEPRCTKEDHSPYRVRRFHRPLRSGFFQVYFARAAGKSGWSGSQASKLARSPPSTAAISKR